MKKLFLFVVPALLTLASCQKDNNDPSPSQDDELYINTKTGSTWTYHEVNSSAGDNTTSDYTITSTDRDTTIMNRKYHVYSYSYGDEKYLASNGKQYYEYSSIPGSTEKTFEWLYLNTAVNAGAEWSQDVSLDVEGLQIPLKITNKLEATGQERTIDGTTYKNVIVVSSRLSSALIPANALTTDITSYYARGYGLIENSSKVSLDYLGQKIDVNVLTTLTSATLK